MTVLRDPIRTASAATWPRPEPERRTSSVDPSEALPRSRQGPPSTWLAWEAKTVTGFDEASVQVKAASEGIGIEVGQETRTRYRPGTIAPNDQVAEAVGLPAASVRQAPPWASGPARSVQPAVKVAAGSSIVASVGRGIDGRGATDSPKGAALPRRRVQRSAAGWITVTGGAPEPSRGV